MNEKFLFDQYTTSYGISPDWDHLNIMYQFLNPDEIKKFIRRNNDDLKILLLYVPIFVQKHFPEDIISLELITDPDTGKDILKAHIHTSISPSEASKKLHIN